MPKITWLLVIRHEQARLRDCLDHLAHHVDEIVVVHDGECRDKSLEIACEYTDKIFERPGEQNPHPQYQWALRNAIDGGWVFVQDADERASAELLANLRSLAEQAEADGSDGVAFVHRGLVDGEVVYERPGHWRLFKHSNRVSWPTHPHGGIEGLTKGPRTNFVYENYSWAKELPSKVRRRNAHLRRLLRENPDSPRRVAWEAGLKMQPEIQALLDEKGISMEVDGSPLLEVKGIGPATADALADLGVETVEELFGADAGYLSRKLGVGEKRVRKWQEEASGILGFHHQIRSP